MHSNRNIFMYWCYWCMYRMTNQIIEYKKGGGDGQHNNNKFKFGILTLSMTGPCSRMSQTRRSCPSLSFLHACWTYTEDPPGGKNHGEQGQAWSICRLQKHTHASFKPQQGPGCRQLFDPWSDTSMQSTGTCTFCLYIYMSQNKNMRMSTSINIVIMEKDMDKETDTGHGHGQK